MQEYVPRIPKIVSEYGIKPNPPSVRQGIESVLPGLQELQVCQSLFTRIALV